MPTFILLRALAKTGSLWAETERRTRMHFEHASNAWVTLMAGFTTVQSMGSPGERPLRDAIANGSLPGPRILTAVEALVRPRRADGDAGGNSRLYPQAKAAGADVDQNLRRRGL